MEFKNNNIYWGNQHSTDICIPPPPPPKQFNFLLLSIGFISWVLNMARSDSQINKPQPRHPKRAELLDVNINTGVNVNINTGMHQKSFKKCWRKKKDTLRCALLPGWSFTPCNVYTRSAVLHPGLAFQSPRAHVLEFSCSQSQCKKNNKSLIACWDL